MDPHWSINLYKSRKCGTFYVISECKCCDAEGLFKFILLAVLKIHKWHVSSEVSDFILENEITKAKDFNILYSIIFR